MGGKVLLDTNIIIKLFSGIKEIVELISFAEEVFIPSIAIGELFFGAINSVKAKQNIIRIEELMLKVPVLGCDISTAKEYGILKSKLKKKGRPIPENDIWIAAISMQYNLCLITMDSHFMNIDGLDVKMVSL